MIRLRETKIRGLLLLLLKGGEKYFSLKEKLFAYVSAYKYK